MRNLALIAALGATSACAGSGFIPAPSNAPVYQPAAQSPPAPVRQPVRQPMRGPQSIIGQSAQALTARLGKTRIDLREGDARKLQFAGPTCVLDIYLYPREYGTQPVATHAEARLKDGGASIDSAACTSEIARR